MRLLILLTLSAAAAGCTTAPLNAPVEVLRYHLGPQIARGTVALEPISGGPAGVDYRAYADAVAAELTRAGYSPVTGGPARFTATVDYRRGGREALERGPTFSLGVGGGSYGRGGGVGGGVGVPIGGAKVREIVGTELSVKIAERGGAGAGVVWEGRAMTEADARLPDASPEIAARKLSEALFRGFPGESGRTITVK
ncbi:MAG: hypothetical protein V4659_08235 [Pseudomonadota bacterium]